MGEEQDWEEEEEKGKEEEGGKEEEERGDREGGDSIWDVTSEPTSKCRHTIQSHNTASSCSPTCSSSDMTCTKAWYRVLLRVRLTPKFRDSKRLHTP